MQQQMSGSSSPPASRASSDGLLHSHYVELLSGGLQEAATAPPKRWLRGLPSIRTLVHAVVLVSFSLLFASYLISTDTLSRLQNGGTAALVPPPSQPQQRAAVPAASVQSVVVPSSPAFLPPPPPPDLRGVMEGLTTFQEEFNAFMTKYNKVYKSAAEKAMRFEIFVKNLIYIVSHNRAASTSFELAVNEFADMTQEEFQRTHVGGYRANRSLEAVSSDDEASVAPREVAWDLLAPRANDSIPATMDWTTTGCVAKPRDQRKCGSCWTFSAVGAVEGAHCIKHGELVELSEQQLVDCAFPEGNSGCNGGSMDNAFQYMIDVGGMCKYDSYAYAGKVGKCMDTGCEKLVKVTGFKDVPNDSELALRTAIAEVGPVSVAIDAASPAFQFYHRGVFDGPCACNLNHAVLAVGYGSDKTLLGNEDYWLVKNSWGPAWGDHGFIKMRRNTGLPMGKCGIQMDPTYPIVE